MDMENENGWSGAGGDEVADADRGLHCDLLGHFDGDLSYFEPLKNSSRYELR